MELAEALREGLTKIRTAYQRQFYESTSFSEQWQCLVIKEAYDIDFYNHKKTVEDRFAWKSHRLYNKLKEAA